MADQQKKPEKPIHPIKGTPLDTRAKEPGKNVNRQIAVAENMGKTSDRKAMLEAGYSQSYADNPQMIKSSKSFTQILDEVMPDTLVLAQHNSMLNARRLDHMTFPVNMEDDDIAELLSEVNCVLRKVVHGVQAKHVYFWSKDNRAIKDALDMVYKLKGKYAPEKFQDVSKYAGMSTQDLIKRKNAALTFLKKKPVTPPNQQQ